MDVSYLRALLLVLKKQATFQGFLTANVKVILTEIRIKCPQKISPLASGWKGAVRELGVSKFAFTEGAKGGS